jgi:hypothetical protein
MPGRSKTSPIGFMEYALQGIAGRIFAESN